VKVLLDACVWGKSRDTLASAGHDVIWAGDWPQDPGDDEILRMAASDRRTLITLDKDFGELAIVKRVAHRGIVRLVRTAAIRQGSVSLMILARYASDLESGALITVEPGRVRIRLADADELS